MRRAAPVTFRWLVAGIVAVLTLLGGSVRPSAIAALRMKAALEHVERTGDGADRAHLERTSELSRVRVGRPCGGPDTAGSTPAIRSSVLPLCARRRTSFDETPPPARVDVVTRRVRPHVENMVFLI